MDVEIYGVTYHIVDCDEFTKDLEKLALRQFLGNDRKVLRFYAVLDNKNESLGGMRQFVIQYYLSDDTTRVNEVYKNNSGYLEFPTFYRNQRIPKKVQGVVMDEPRAATITADVLMIGRIVNIFNRLLLLYDCDEYTENYYLTVYGITESSHVLLPELIYIALESV
ncbi:MAG: putative flagellar protofilament ribbon protein rib74 [Streblomastix strix]|uniref:Putative flagellar protofilament ribbon protein rib74 n=1 Tax=Streblomastix strix TaxID=222440 RepID=A0A5J4URW9_9EUKA|nr:MAG: putative flagellar protofilament ribbon protein rib74 [Streblomastix strix]